MKDYVIAKIREDDCIGCMKCIKACPVDAIIGTSKYMHSVIPHECIGCKLCVEPCPMDCIELISNHGLVYDSNLSKTRHKAKIIREKSSITPTAATINTDKKAYILDAIKRVAEKKNQ